MADISFLPSPSFLALLGEPLILWGPWLRSFEMYLIVLGLADVSAAQKKALLLGSDGQLVLRMLGDTNDFTCDTAVGLLSTQFAAS